MDWIVGHFRESMAVISIVLAIVFVAIFIWTSLLRREVLKIIGMLAVLGVSLFADHPTSYFLAILVLATLVAKLEFLQNIAAIIRNSDAYFQHFVEKKSQKEIEASINHEIMEENQAMKENGNGVVEDADTSSFMKSNLNPVQFQFIVEGCTFTFLENKYGAIINRYVKLPGTSQEAKFDGMMNLGKKTTLFLEIKVMRRGSFPVEDLNKEIERTANFISQYSGQLSQNLELRYIFVGNIKESFVSRVKSLKPEAADVNIRFEFYTFEDLGLTDIINAPGTSSGK
ncbi:hypothetical protein GCM10008986_31690 [Salinibacillus aidingensis]|uniref:Uncharacterized protein n=1 Tax=Salinibacillus aidingensis TaxID=237684 RepID=A0ABP3LIY5_9BACI